MATTVPGFSGTQYYPFLVDPLSHVPTRPRAPPVNKGTTSTCRPQGIAHSPQDLGSFTVPSPWHPRDGRHLQMHVATATFTAPPRLHLQGTALGFFRTPRPPLDPIKGKAEGSPGKGTYIFSTTEINISSNTPFSSFLETWDRLPLLQFVTPAQALRCKKIQYSPLAGRRAFFARTRINPRVFSLHHHPD
jgi:hypothetical protein